MKEKVLQKKEFDEKLNSLISGNKLFKLQTTETEKRLEYENTLFKFKIVKSSIERINTVEDAFADQKIDLKAFLKKCKQNGDTQDEIAYKILKVVFKAVNAGDKINYGNGNQKKYWPYFVWNANKSAFVFSGTNYDYDYTNAGVGVRLCCLSEANAAHIGKNFEKVFNQFLS